MGDSFHFIRARYGKSGEWELPQVQGSGRCFELRVHLRLGVGTVWRGIDASGGWSRLPSLGETQCRRLAWPYGGVRQLGRVRGQAQGRHVRGSDGTGGTRSGQTRWIRHPLRITTPGRLGMLLGGALRGRSPRTREGRIGPTAQMSEDREKVGVHLSCGGELAKTEEFRLLLAAG